MEDNEQLTWHRKVLRVLFWLTWVIYIPPLALYGQARLNGSLPSEAVWEKRGGNHGPWWGETQGDFIQLWLLVMAALPYVTFLYALTASSEINTGTRSVLAKGIGLALAQFLAGFWVFLIVFWTID